MLNRRRLLSAGLTMALSLTRSAPVWARRHRRVIVAGAGIAGLYAAWRLQEDGCEVVVLEAAKRIGGRNFSVRNGDQVPDLIDAPQTAQFAPGCVLDAGPWRIPPNHVRMHQLIGRLAVDTEPVGFVGQDQMVRIAGGMDGLPRALAARLEAPPVTDCRVQRVRRSAAGVELHASAGGSFQAWHGDALLFALPPSQLARLDHDLDIAPQLLQATQRFDAIKIALMLGRAPAPTPTEALPRGLQRLVPRRMPDLGVIYGNQQALNDALQGTRQQQIAAATALMAAPIASALCIRFASLPGIGAAFDLPAPPLLQQLRAGLPPYFFASDALSELNGWQEGALAAADHALEHLFRFLA